MPTSNQAGGGSPNAPAPGTVSLDAELAERLVGALETIGTAFKLDEINDARTLALIGRLRGDDGYGGTGTSTVPVDPKIVRAARDYDVVRGLLGRADAPPALRMKREKSGGGNSVVIADMVPASACAAVVESPGDGTSGPLAEPFDIAGGRTDLTLELECILPGMPIWRVEIFDRHGALVAFGPSFQPLVH